MPARGSLLPLVVFLRAAGGEKICLKDWEIGKKESSLNE